MSEQGNNHPQPPNPPVFTQDGFHNLPLPKRHRPAIWTFLSGATTWVPLQGWPRTPRPALSVRNCLKPRRRSR